MRHNTRFGALFVLFVALAGTAAAASAQQVASGRKFMVVTGHPDATAAAVKVLQSGGNVVDAAVTASLCVGVAEPYGSGLGGKLMMLYRDGATGRVVAVEAMCAAPSKLNSARFANLSSHDRSYGYTSVAVPGLLAGLYAAHEQWGQVPWKDLVLPAAELAEQGVAMMEKIHQVFRGKQSRLTADPETARLYLVDGKAPPVGTLLKNADMGHSLRLIAEEGPRAFYEGQIARRIVAAANQAGAPLSLDDFRRYRPQQGEPLAIHFGGYELYSCPPPLTGGTTVLSALKVLEHMQPFDAADGRDAEYIDRVGRVLLAVYPPITRKIADVPTARADALALLGARAARQMSAEAEQYDPANPYAKPAPVGVGAGVDEATADDRPDSSTTHLTVADSDGNIVCLTQSLSNHFGACVIAPGTGFLLNDSMSNFSTRNPKAANFARPGQRERSTIAPVIAAREGQPVLALGIPGGQRIPTTTLQLLLDVLQYDVPLQEAFARPRFHVRRPIGSEVTPNIVDLESNAPRQLDERLAELGWKVVRKNPDGSYFGGGNAIMYDADGGLQGVADTRRANFAAGK